MFSHHVHSESVRSVTCLAHMIGLVAWTGLLTTLSQTASAQQIIMVPAQAMHLELSLPENSAAKTLVGKVSEHFPSLTNFRLAERSRSTAFTVDQDTGAILVREGAVLNYERRARLLLTIVADRTPEAKDPFLDTFAESLLNEGLTTRRLEKILPAQQLIHVQIALEDVPEPPGLVPQSFSIPESIETLSPVGIIRAEDQDANEAFRYEIVGGNEDAVFTMDESTGQLRICAVDLNSQENRDYLLKVRVTDNSGLTAVGELSVHFAESAPRSTESGPESTVTSAEATPITIVPAPGTEPAPHLDAEPGTAMPQPTRSDLPNQDEAVAAQNSNVVGQTVEAEEVLSLPNLTGKSNILQVESKQNSTSIAPAMPVPAEPVPAEPIPSRTVPSLPVPSAEDGSSASDSLADPSPASASDVVLHLSKTDAAPEEIPPQIMHAASKTRETLALFIAVSLVTVLVFSYRLAMMRRKEAQRLKLEEDAQFEARLAELKALEHAAEQQAAADLAAAPPETESGDAESENERIGFDPEDLISDDFFSQTTDHSVSPANSHSATDGTCEAGSESADAVLALKIELEQRDDVIAELKSKIAALGDRLELLAAQAETDPSMADVPAGQDCFQDQSEGESGWGRSRRRPSTDDSDLEWNDNPARPDSLRRFQPAGRFDRQPQYSSENPAGSDPELSGMNATAEAVIPEQCVLSTDAVNLRNELADLFAIHSSPGTSRNSVTQQTTEEPAPESTEQKSEKAIEESHLDSVAKYLSELLDRSKKEEGNENGIFADRRRTNAQSSGKWDGVDRRAGSQKPKPQVKSYIETYLSEHGGKLEPVKESVSANTAESTAEPEISPRAAVVRTPVDVNAIRQHMNSFRQVATVSVEHALASYQIRQERGKLTWRYLLAGGLVVIAAISIVTNVARTIRFASLNWMMGAIIFLCLAELALRVQSIRRHRKELQLRIQEPQRSSGPPEKPTEAAEASNSKQP